MLRREDGTFGLINETGDHNHDCNEAEIIADEMKVRMCEIVKKDPSAPVGDAIKKAKTEIIELYGENEQVLKDVMSELGSKHALEQMLLRVREKILGPMPKNRNDFMPKAVLKKLYREKAEDIVVMDSNELPNDWEDLIGKENPNTEYGFSKMEDLIRKHEDAQEDNEEEEQEEGNDDDGYEEGNEEKGENGVNGDATNENKDKPKRVLAYSTKKLLKLFAKCKRGSVDGTFKSICKMWGQLFVWMVKKNGHWIPVVWGWLPDKNLTSYKVFLHLVLGALKEASIPFNQEEIISDFELNIHKAIVDVLGDVKILGCFFHLAKAFKMKVDKKGMKNAYENDENFRNFVKQATALSLTNCWMVSNI